MAQPGRVKVVLYLFMRHCLRHLLTLFLHTIVLGSLFSASIAAVSDYLWLIVIARRNFNLFTAAPN